MQQNNLSQAVARMAELTQGFGDPDLEQPWAWRAHDEGVRFALIGAYHELRELAVALAHQRAQNGPPLTRAQRALAQYLAAYRDFQAVLIGVTAKEYDREPAPGEWPLRYVVGHTAGTQRHFFTLVHYGVARQRDEQERSARLPEGETDKVTGSYEDFAEIMENQAMADMLAFYENLHQRTLSDFANVTDAELAGPSLWWEGEEYSLEYRLHRFDAHLRQHTIQLEKTLAMLGHSPNEARRLLRLIYNALAEVEGVTLGAEALATAQRQEVAQAIVARAEEVAGLVARNREMIAAVRAGDRGTVKELLAGSPATAQARDDEGLSALLTAVYRGQPEIAADLMAQGAVRTIFEAAATGQLDEVKAAHAEWEGWIDQYSRSGYTPLQLAAFFGHQETALWLIEQGADVNAVARNDMRIQPIHAAAANGNLAVLTALLERGADVNARQAGGFTPLHAAADNDNAPMARLLLDYAADPTVAGDNGQTPRALAESKGHHAVAELLRPQSQLKES